MMRTLKSALPKLNAIPSAHCYHTDWPLIVMWDYVVVAACLFFIFLESEIFAII